MQFRKFVIVVALYFISFSSMAFSVVPSGKLTSLENGWSGNGLAIHHENSTSGCDAPDTEYAIDKDHPSYDLLVSMALAAFTAELSVQLVVEPSVCLFGNRTKILSIRLIK